MRVAIVVLTAIQAAATAPSDTFVSGTYRNVDYGFAVRLPKGIHGVMAPPPAPNHGFNVAIPDTAGATVNVFTYYNSTFAGNLREAAAEFMAPVSLTDARLQISSTTLGGLSALHLRFGEGHEPVFHREVIIALRNQTDGVGILYILDLKALPADFARANKVFQGLKESFRLLRIPGA
jgi:hypothetical protein